LNHRANEADSRRESRDPLNADAVTEPVDDFVAEPVDEVFYALTILA
jgi:hypothetical protein